MNPTLSPAVTTPPAGSPDAEASIRELAKSLPLEQQIQLLTGADVWATHALPSIGLSRVVLSDGPSGVRGEDFDERHDSISLPSSSALSATWSVDTLAAGFLAQHLAVLAGHFDAPGGGQGGRRRQ